MDFSLELQGVIICVGFLSMVASKRSFGANFQSLVFLKRCIPLTAAIITKPIYNSKSEDRSQGEVNAH